MVTKNTFVTLFLALFLILISADTLEFAERTHHPIPPTIDLPVEPSYDPPPFAQPLTVAKKPENGDRPELRKEKGNIGTIHPRTKPRIDFLKSLKKGGPKFSEPIHRVISTSLASQIGWKYSPPRVSRITEIKPVGSEESLPNTYRSILPETGGESGPTKVELLRSRMMKAEVFMRFRLSFSPKGEFSIEMNLDPAAEKGIGVSFPADTVRLPSESIPSISQTNAPSLFNP